MIIKAKLSILLLFAATFSVFGQQAWKSYEWETYGIGFDLPDSYEVTLNTESALEAKGEGLRFAIYAMDDQTGYSGDLAGFVVHVAETDLNLDEIDEMEMLDVDGFESGILIGKKEALQYLIFGLRDLENGNRFYGYVAFEAEQEQVVEDALEVFMSFGKI